MENQFTLAINKPCSENFSDFAPTLLGGFCNSCKKEVIDFTKMNNEEISVYFNTHNNTDVCGRLLPDQLKVVTHPVKNRTMINVLRGVGLACLSLFFSSHLHAQDIKNKSINKDVNRSENVINNVEKRFVVKGKVTEDSNPLPGVNIVLQGTRIGTQTDFDGTFTFPEKLKKGDILIFSFVGFESKKIIITDEKSASNIDLHINMSLDTVVLTGKVSVKKVYHSKKKN